MKEYKPYFGRSILLFCFESILIGLPIIIAFVLLFEFIFNDELPMLMILLLVPVIFILIGFLFYSISLIVNIFIKMIVSPHISLDDENAYIDNVTIPYGEICCVSYFMGKISKSSSTPSQVTLILNDRTEYKLKRPSIRLLHALKKRCKNAVFRVEDLKKNIFSNLIMGIVTSTILTVIFLFFNLIIPQKYRLSIPNFKTDLN